MSQDRMSSVIKCGTNTFYSNTFVWNINNTNNARNLTSNIFQFCGYNCYLKYSSFTDLFYGRDQLTITLIGYQAPYKKDISCHYSLLIKNDVLKYPVTETGEIHSTKEAISVDLFEDIYLFSKNAETICFSWCENGDSYKSSKSVQTDPVISSNILEKGTQTDEIPMPVSIRNSCTHAEHESHKFLDTLSNDFGTFFENRMDPDCILIVGETEIPAHRSVLSARSSVFAAMFYYDTTESQSGKVKIHDVNPDALTEVLYFLYTGKVRGLSPETAAQMYTISNKYALIDIRDKCLEYLLCNLTLENICDAALLAHTHALADLEKKAVQFVKNRLQELMESEKWKHFSDAHYKIANKLLCSALTPSQIGKT